MGRVVQVIADVVDDVGITEDSSDLLMSIEIHDLLFELVRHKLVIRVQKGDIFSRRMIETVPRRGNGAAISFEGEKRDPGVLYLVYFGNRAVGRPVVGNHDLKILKRLAQSAPYCLGDVFLMVVRRHQYADFGHINTSNLKCLCVPQQFHISASIHWLNLALVLDLDELDHKTHRLLV